MTNPAVSGPAPASDHDGVSSATAIMPKWSAQRKRERVLSGLTSKLAAVKLRPSRVEGALRKANSSGSIGASAPAENEAHRAPAIRSDFAARDRGERQDTIAQIPAAG
jgi:hypothetical protein